MNNWLELRGLPSNRWRAATAGIRPRGYSLDHTTDLTLATDKLLDALNREDEDYGGAE